MAMMYCVDESRDGEKISSGRENVTAEILPKICRPNNYFVPYYSCPFKSTVVLAKAAINFGKAALESNNLSSIVEEFEFVATVGL